MGDNVNIAVFTAVVYCRLCN